MAKIRKVFREEARVSRPDLEEYHLKTLSGENLELWWDDQPGVGGTSAEGWCVRVIERVISSNGRERDIPVPGRRDSKWSTILRNVSKAINNG